MLCAQAFGQHASMAALILHGGSIEPCGECHNGGIIQIRHDPQNSAGIDPAGQKHAIGHVGSLMNPNAVPQRIIQPGQRFGFGNRLRSTLGKCGQPVALNNPALPHDQRFPRQHTLYAFQGQIPPTGKLQLQKGIPGFFIQFWINQSRLDQCPRLRREGKGAGRFNIIQGLNAKRIPAEDQTAPRCWIMDRDGIHAAQRLGILHPIPAIQEQRGLAIGCGAKRRIWHRCL